MLLSEKVPVAVNCSAVPRAMTGLVGVTAMDTSVFGDEELPPDDGELLLPPPPPQLVTNATISKRTSVLFVFIRYHYGQIGPLYGEKCFPVVTPFTNVTVLSE